MNSITSRCLSFTVIIFTLTACATNQPKDITPLDQQASSAPVNPDPFEKINRGIFKFNQDFDEAILVPFARGYRKNLHKNIRLGIYNFFSNAAEGRNMVNSLLQGKIHRAVDSFTRMFVNTVFGLCGLIEIATQTVLDRHVEDIGQTLAVWGADFGPYIVLPILGPSRGRDVFGLYSYFFYTDPLGYIDDSTARFSMLVLDMVDTRSRYLRASSVFGFASLDPYLFARESYFQQRLDMIYDGAPPVDY